jgi:hypothetical protein
MPVVSEEYWDQFVTFRYPSMEALKNMYKSDRFHEANAHAGAPKGEAVTLHTSQSSNALLNPHSAFPLPILTAI